MVNLNFLGVLGGRSNPLPPGYRLVTRRILTTARVFMRRKSTSLIHAYNTAILLACGNSLVTVMNICFKFLFLTLQPFFFCERSKIPKIKSATSSNRIRRRNSYLFRSPISPFQRDTFPPTCGRNLRVKNVVTFSSS